MHSTQPTRCPVGTSRADIHRAAALTLRVRQVRQMSGVLLHTGSCTVAPAVQGEARRVVHTQPCTTLPRTLIHVTAQAPGSASGSLVPRDVEPAAVEQIHVRWAPGDVARTAVAVVLTRVIFPVLVARASADLVANSILVRCLPARHTQPHPHEHHGAVFVKLNSAHTQ